MTEPPKCGCDREGRYCHAGEMCKNEEPCPCCAPVSPVDKGLDFEAARSSARIGPNGEEHPDIFEHALQAQHLAALEGVRKEEREKAKELAEMANHLYHCRDCGDLSPMSCDTWANHPTWEQTYRATLEAE